jgi:TetR/AcrR family transcriptional regulator, fatty acid metabolism regulator protein
MPRCRPGRRVVDAGTPVPAVGTASGRSPDRRLLNAAKTLFARHGYENASTSAIARAAGTSESQLMKYFGSKEGLLEAIFDASWEDINGQVREVLAGSSSPAEKLDAFVSIMVSSLERDPEIKLLMLLEGRRVRKEGEQVAISHGYREFVRLTDGVLHQARAAGHLRPHLQVEAVRSALIGMVEGLMRDRVLAARSDFPAHYGSKQIRTLARTVLACFTSSR